MALFDIFRRSGIRTLPELAAFIDEQAARLADKTVDDYAAVRAGPGAKALLAEPGLRAGLDKARAEAAPLALAMIGEMVEGALRPHAGDNESRVRAGLTALVLERFDHKSGGAVDESHAAARSEIARSLADTAHRSLKPAAAIADAYASLFLAVMPIHEKLGGDDFPALNSALRTELAAVHARLIERADLPNLAAQFASGPAERPVPAA